MMRRQSRLELDDRRDVERSHGGAVLSCLVNGERTSPNRHQGDRVHDPHTRSPSTADGSPPFACRGVTISTPTLVIHGTADPTFPLEHGHALAEEIPNAHLVAANGSCHGGLRRRVATQSTFGLCKT
jgi:pimeloyl-ACP methyl ester carboxylesterase